MEGDSGFGFSGMEVEIICRYRVPMKTAVLSNGGSGAAAGAEPPEGLIGPGILGEQACCGLVLVLRAGGPRVMDWFSWPRFLRHPGCPPA